MKIIETNGIVYIERLAESSQWYFGTDYSCGDLYEAEEVYKNGEKFRPNRVIFVHHPDGRLVEPIIAKENQYFGIPVQQDGIIYQLLVDFEKQIIKVIDCGRDFEHLDTVLELPLSEVKNCYNLRLEGAPIMLTRHGDEDCFEIIWPERHSFPIGDSESFFFRKGDMLFFSRWMEDTEYREEIVVRDLDGNIIEVKPGGIFIMPTGEEWILR